MWTTGFKPRDNGKNPSFHELS